ncbi:hypothetical protein JCM5350_008087 [Sporobolomyces pararoseus]
MGGRVDERDEESGSFMDEVFDELTGLRGLEFRRGCAEVGESVYYKLAKSTLETITFGEGEEVDLEALSRAIENGGNWKKIELNYIEGRVGTRIESAGEAYSGQDGSKSIYPDWTVPWLEEGTEVLECLVTVGQENSVEVSGTAIEAIRVLKDSMKGGIMGGFRPAGSTSNTRPIPPPAPSIAKPVPLSKQQQQQSTSTPSTSTIARRVEGVPGSVRGDSIKLGKSTGGPSTGRRSPLSSTTNHHQPQPQPQQAQTRTPTTAASSSSATLVEDIDLKPVIKKEKVVASNHFQQKKTNFTSTSTSTSTPKQLPPPPLSSSKSIPMKRPSPVTKTSSKDKGKGKAVIVEEEEEEEEEIDELASSSSELEEEEDNFPSPNQQQQKLEEETGGGGGGRKKKKARTSKDSGFTEGDEGDLLQDDKENDPNGIVEVKNEDAEMGMMEDQEIPESENGEGELAGLALGEETRNQDVAMRDVQSTTTRNGIGDGGGDGDAIRGVQDEKEEDQEIVQVEGELLALTNRRISILKAFVEIAQNGGGRSSDGLDENELRHTQSHVNERYDEARGRLQALGVAPTELQICKEKQASCLEELYEVLQAPEGSLSSNGNDRGLIEHTLSYFTSRIPGLEAAQSNQSRPPSRPSIPRISTLAAGPLPSVHGSPSAVPGSRPSYLPGSPSVVSLGGTRTFQPPQPQQQRQQGKKASSVTSGTESQNSATIAAARNRSVVQAGGPSNGLPASTNKTTVPAPPPPPRSHTSTSEQITLDSPSSEKDPVQSPRSIKKRPPPQITSNSSNGGAAVGKSGTGGFRAAGRGIGGTSSNVSAKQPVQRREEPSASA